MDIDKHVLGRLEELITEATALLEERTQLGGMIVPRDPWLTWHAASEALIRQLLDEGHPYCQRFEKYARSPEVERVASGRALLQRVHDDYAKGYLGDLRNQALGEVITDLLDLSAYFVSEGYHAAVPISVAGAVLEDFLRRLHGKHIAEWQDDSSISALNDALYKANIYGKPEWRQIQVWSDVRNDAAHGHFEKVDAAKAAQMVEGIRGFVAKH